MSSSRRENFLDDTRRTRGSRKVTFDDTTGTFAVESRLEALERQVAARAKMTFVLNRSQQTKYNLLAQQAEGALDIFCRQLETEGHKRLQTLRDHALHHQALMELSSRAGNQAPRDNILARQELHALIQEQLKESTPSAKRRKRCQHILQKRRPLKIFDRTQTTSALLRMKDAISSRPASDRLKVTPRMVLPPIAVRWRPQSTEQPGESGFKSQSGNVFITSIGPNV